MKITKRKITAAQDFRSFDGFSPEELKELDPDFYYDVVYNIRNDVDTIYLSKNSDCEYIGALDSDGNYFYYKLNDPETIETWFESSFEELANLLK